MHYAVLRLMGNVTTWAAVLSMTTMASLPTALADEAQAKALFKAMSDYLAAQQTLSYDYDTTLEIVAKDKQKLGLASSGSVTLHRPDKIRATRAGGFAQVELVFDGQTLSLLGKHANQYVQADPRGDDGAHASARPGPAAETQHPRDVRRRCGLLERECLQSRHDGLPHAEHRPHRERRGHLH